VLGKLQNTRIYCKLKRKNKLHSWHKLINKSICRNNKKHYLCGGNYKLNYLGLSCLNHELNHKERADRHITDNQDYNDFYNNRLGGARSLVRIQSSRQELKKSASIMKFSSFLFNQNKYICPNYGISQRISQSMDRENPPINCLLEQAACIVWRSKITTGTLEPTESYKRGQAKEL